MIRRNRGSGVALPHDALDVPEGLIHPRIRDWTDYGIWGLLFFDEQPPWFTLIECMHIIFYKAATAPTSLFEPPSMDKHGNLRHETVNYRVPLNLELRYLLFRDVDAIRVTAHGSPSVQTQWQNFDDRTTSGASDLGLSFDHLQQVFHDVKSLSDALDLLRRAEVESFSGKRWTSRSLSDLLRGRQHGPDHSPALPQPAAGSSFVVSWPVLPW